MLRSDFAWLNFDTEFVQPNQEATRTFFIDDEPVLASRAGQSVSSEGYIMIQAENVGNSSTDEGDPITHRILINGEHLPSFDMVAREGWNLWMDRIPKGILKKGENRLTVRRRAVDRFRVANIMVQWREKSAASGGVVGSTTVTANA
ncbi:hypothetical protein [Cognatiyoonia sp. IB215182]|uniref:DUF7383 domain-containing protein n=1 Tax=Cognatiyoonia sp. IB215182 TaxID=3097353 RepID=UPI002A1087C4|nr:hypothetical protein [Cognatiyoonia sp. IB215182]MDX8355787.1 hypothetical protein [Cognatiyoonia sp. IB215182]